MHKSPYIAKARMSDVSPARFPREQAGRARFIPLSGGVEGMVRGWKADDEQKVCEAAEAEQREQAARQNRIEEIREAVRHPFQEFKEWLLSLLPLGHKVKEHRGTKAYINAILPDVMEAVRASFNRRGRHYANNKCPFSGAGIARLIFGLALLGEGDKEGTVKRYVCSNLSALGYVLSPEGGRLEGSDSELERDAATLLNDVRAILGPELPRLKQKRA